MSIYNKVSVLQRPIRAHSSRSLENRSIHRISGAASRSFVRSLFIQPAGERIGTWTPEKVHLFPTPD